MVRASNLMVGILNLLTLLLGLASIATSVYFFLRDGGDTKCQRFLVTPLLVTGLFVSIVSLMGLIGSFCRVNLLLWLYLIVVFFMILGLLAFTVFVFMVTNVKVARVLDTTKTVNYSHWLEKHFVNGDKWLRIKSCLQESEICRKIDSPASATEFYDKNLTPIQEGCCKPPKDCGFKYQNATVWIAEKEGGAVADNDCKTWSNEQQTLCYDCDSCKRGFLSNINKQWRHLMISNLCILLLMICAYTLGCCAKKNNSRHNHKYSGYYRT